MLQGFLAYQKLGAAECFANVGQSALLNGSFVQFGLVGFGIAFVLHVVGGKGVVAGEVRSGTHISIVVLFVMKYAVDGALLGVTDRPRGQSLYLIGVVRRVGTQLYLPDAFDREVAISIASCGSLRSVSAKWTRRFIPSE